MVSVPVSFSSCYKSPLILRLPWLLHMVTQVTISIYGYYGNHGGMVTLWLLITMWLQYIDYSRPPPIPPISGLTKKRPYSEIGGIWGATVVLNKSRTADKIYLQFDQLSSNGIMWGVFFNK